MVKAILFDMNGVLIDSERLNRTAWEELFKEYKLGFSLNLYESQIDGKSTKEVAEEYGIKDKEKFVERKDEIWFDLYEQQGIEVFDDVVSNLQRLKQKGWLLGVTSSSRKADFILKDLHLYEFFDVIVNSRLLQRGKPFPDIYIEAMRQLNVEPNETIVIEDSDAGIKAATMAHTTCFKIQRCEKSNIMSANCIKSLDEI